ncbi:hypothetical protein Tco_1030854 [Tanacetum coccineum]|uniref:Uncharacterized protein n=1 Tax=Tanacetum coccineum TaxID=301880 RepID=A0ABQ5G8I0_9ASTR
MQTNESRVVSRDYSKQPSKARKNQDVDSSQVVKDLRSENARNLDKLSMLRAVAASAKDSRQKLSKELDELHLSVKEVDCLGQRCPDLEAGRDFLLSNSTLLILRGLSWLDIFFLWPSKIFLSLNISIMLWDFKYVVDYHLEAEKIYEMAVKSFYKLEFPYISLLIKKVGQRLGKLAVVDPPITQEATSS